MVTCTPEKKKLQTPAYSTSVTSLICVRLKNIQGIWTHEKKWYLNLSTSRHVNPRNRWVDAAAQALPPEQLGEDTPKSMKASRKCMQIHVKMIPKIDRNQASNVDTKLDNKSYPYAPCIEYVTNTCPCPKPPSHLGKYTSTMGRIWLMNWGKSSRFISPTSAMAFLAMASIWQPVKRWQR